MDVANPAASDVLPQAGRTVGADFSPPPSKSSAGQSVSTVPIFAPDGSIGDIPSGQLASAVKSGAKPGIHITAPDGSPGVVPADRLQDAVKAGAKIVPIEDQPVQHPGFWASMGADLGGMAKGAFNQVGAAMSAMSGNPVPGAIQAAQTIQNVSDNAQHRKDEGRSLPYRTVAPVGDVLGVNTRGMEDAADQGDVAGVAGHAAAVPVAMAATEGLTRGGPAVADAAAPAVRATVRTINKGLEKAPTAIGTAAGAAIGAASRVPFGTEVGAGLGAAIGKEVLPQVRIPGEGFGLPDTVEGGPASAPQYKAPPEAPTTPAAATPAAPVADPAAALGKIPLKSLSELSPKAVTQAIQELGQKASIADLTKRANTLETQAEAPVAAPPVDVTPKSVQAQLENALGGKPTEPLIKGVSLRNQAAVQKARTLADLSGSAQNAPPTAGASDLTSQLQQSLDRASAGKVPADSTPPPGTVGDLPTQIKKSLQQAEPLPEGFTPVDSSVLKAYKYSPEAREFESITNDGRHYVHGDVSPEEAQAFADADSKGKAWSKLKSQSPLVGKVVNGRRVNVIKPRTVVTDPQTGAPEFSDVLDARQNSASQ
jgi:hypothetical protein